MFRKDATPVSRKGVTFLTEINVVPVFSVTMHLALADPGEGGGLTAANL